MVSCAPTVALCSSCHVHQLTSQHRHWLRCKETQLRHADEAQQRTDIHQLRKIRRHVRFCIAAASGGNGDGQQLQQLYKQLNTVE